MTDRRKPRVLLFDDEPVILKVLEKYFLMEGYEVFSYAEPETCPVYKGIQESCARMKPCTDLVITDFRMPGMSGAELLERQRDRGCRLGMESKAIISGYLPEEELERVRNLGCAFFRKPFTLKELSPWLKTCEARMDLSQPLGILRREARRPTDEAITYQRGGHAESLKGTVVNISRSGLCLKVADALSGGRTIVIQSGLSNRCRRGEIRWIRKAGRGEFVVGLNCR